MLRNAVETWRTRGGAVLVSAGLNLLRANVHRRVLSRRFMQKRIHGSRVLLDLEDRGISRSLILFGTREVDHKIILERVLQPGMAVLDIGANIGYYVLMELGLIGPEGRLVAVEPAPDNVQLLKRNLALNGRGDVPVVEAAVSNSSGEKLFHLSVQSNLNTFHAEGSGAAHLSGESINVRTVTVPELAAQHGTPDLIRMDVEGHEVEIIGGMLDVIRNGAMAPMILFETHLSRYSGKHKMGPVLRAMFAAGYSTRYLASSFQRGTRIVSERGYRGSAPIATDGVERVIFENISNDDAVDFICGVGGARTILLAPDGAAVG